MACSAAFTGCSTTSEGCFFWGKKLTFGLVAGFFYYSSSSNNDFFFLLYTLAGSNVGCFLIGEGKSSPSSSNKFFFFATGFYTAFGFVLNVNYYSSSSLNKSLFFWTGFLAWLSMGLSYSSLNKFYLFTASFINAAIFYLNILRKFIFYILTKFILAMISATNPKS